MKRMLWKWGIVGALAVALMTGYLISQDQSGELSGSEGGTFTLVRPAFAQPAGSGFPQNEAGISAYVNCGQMIDLAKAKGLLKVPEDETESYVIGTVELSGYGEDFWPHAYIGKDGWILVYYPKDEPTSKLMDWHGYQRDMITTTTLREMLFSVARRLGVDMGNVAADMRYYHFQCPDATKFLVVVDTTGKGWDSFRYTIPSALTVYDASASHYAAAAYRWSESKIDGTQLVRGGGGTYVLCEELQRGHLSPGIPHKIEIGVDDYWAGIAIFFLY